MLELFRRDLRRSAVFTRFFASASKSGKMSDLLEQKS